MIFVCRNAALLGFLAGLLPINVALGEQIIPSRIEYSNDRISDQGRVVGCIVTLVALALPDQRTLNFQLLAFNNVLAWMIAGGLFDAKRGSMRAMLAQDGNFSSSRFMIPNAFRKNLTPEGQILAVLSDSNEYANFTAAFFNERFTIDVLWKGALENLTYFISVSPPENVRDDFVKCANGL